MVCYNVLGGSYGTESDDQRNALRAETVARPYRWNKIPNWGGRTLIGGTGYDIELHSDADGLTWYLNETVDLTSNMEVSVDFYSNAERYTGIQIMDFMGRALMYRIASNNSWTMRFGFGRWEAEGYRTLVFDEVPTGTLLEWLQANGTAI